MSQKTSLSVSTLSKIDSVLKKIKKTEISAHELAQYLNIMPRSARRILLELGVTGYAKAVGEVNPHPRGRPRKIYQALLRMHRLGILELPPPRHADPNRSRHRPMELTTASDPGNPIKDPLSALGTIQLVRVMQPKPSRLWNELIQRYHYLRYTPLTGAQIRYLIYTEAVSSWGPLAFRRLLGPCVHETT